MSPALYVGVESLVVAAVVVETAGHVVTAHTVRGRRRICIIDCIAARTAQLRQDDADWQISKHVAIKLLRQFRLPRSHFNSSNYELAPSSTLNSVE